MTNIYFKAYIILLLFNSIENSGIVLLLSEVHCLANLSKEKFNVLFAFHLRFGAPARIPSAIPHSSLPRRILKNRLSPQVTFHAR
jgi:hypothetical protein